MMSLWSRGLVIAVLAFAAACAPPAPPPSEPQTDVAASSSASSQAVLDVLTPLIASEIGKPVSLQPTTANVTDEWAYIAADTLNADGSAIDWATTNLASRYENGAMDEGGGVHALLHKENGVWVVVEQVIAPTDVAWLDWAVRHNVPAGVVDVPAAP